MKPTSNDGAVLTGACGACGAAMDPSKAVYNNQGQLICPSCESADETERYEGRALRSVKKSGYGALGLAGFSWFGGISYLSGVTLLFVAVGAVVTAVGTMTYLLRYPEHKAKLGIHYYGLWIVSVVAIIVAVTRVLLRLRLFTLL